MKLSNLVIVVISPFKAQIFSEAIFIFLKGADLHSPCIFKCLNGMLILWPFPAILYSLAHQFSIDTFSWVFSVPFFAPVPYWLAFPSLFRSNKAPLFIFHSPSLFLSSSVWQLVWLFADPRCIRACHHSFWRNSHSPVQVNIYSSYLLT